MIKSFRDQEAELLFQRIPSRKLPQAIWRTALRKLLMVNAATSLQDLMAPPGNRLEALKAHRKGYHSIRINDQWRLCFRFYQGDAYEVEITDYH